MNIKHRNTCRICGNPNLVPVIDLGRQYLQGSFVKEGTPMPSTRKVPTALVRCDVSQREDACGLVQTACTIPPAIMYSNYWYQSRVSKTMRDHLEGIVKLALDKTTGHREWGCNILDIAANDLTLLNFYPEDKHSVKIGIDPCDIITQVENKRRDIHVVRDFFPSKSIEGRQFGIITSIAMFYDLDDPNVFVNSVKNALSPKGIWCFEMAYLPYILKNLCYDTFCTEHLEHYHLAPIEYLLKKNGLKVVDINLNSINGGSLQVWATHQDNDVYDTGDGKKKIADLRQSEFDLALDEPDIYLKFKNAVSNNRYTLSELFYRIRKAGKTVHLLGASTKANTLIQYCELQKDLKFAAERSSEKHGAKTLGTDISIISEEESRAMKPDFYLVGPWHFKDEIVKREIETMKSIGTKLIFPLPEVSIVGANMDETLDSRGVRFEETLEKILK